MAGILDEILQQAAEEAPRRHSLESALLGPLKAIEAALYMHGPALDSETLTTVRRKLARAVLTGDAEKFRRTLRKILGTTGKSARGKSG